MAIVRFALAGMAAGSAAPVALASPAVADGAFPALKGAAKPACNAVPLLGAPLATGPVLPQVGSFGQRT